VLPGSGLSHQLKANYIYDLPFGSGKRFLSTGNVFKRKAAEGWEFAGVMRVQSGLPFFSQSFGTFLCHQHYRADDRHYHGRQRRGAAQHDPEKNSRTWSASARPRERTEKGIVCYLPDSLMQNTLADGAEYFQPH